VLGDLHQLCSLRIRSSHPHMPPSHVSLPPIWLPHLLCGSCWSRPEQGEIAAARGAGRTLQATRKRRQVHVRCGLSGTSWAARKVRGRAISMHISKPTHLGAYGQTARSRGSCAVRAVRGYLSSVTHHGPPLPLAPLVGGFISGSSRTCSRHWTSPYQGTHGK